MDPPLTNAGRRALAKGQLTIAAYSGPVPPPELLRQFEEILPGAARIIFSEFQEQGLHRRRLEDISVRTNNRRSLIGQAVAGTGLLILLLGGLWLMSRNQLVPGAGSVLVALISAFTAYNKAAELQRESLAGKAPPKRSAR